MLNHCFSRRDIVLVVEDEPLLRMLAIDLVAAAGFDTLSAANADQAIRILEKRNDIAIVFTDNEMPGSMDGVKLAANIHTRWPAIEVILTSPHERMSYDAFSDRGVFLPKPYDSAGVSTALYKLAA